MDDLKRMVVFYHVVDTKSFSGAARMLGMARSAISRHINLLEKSLGVRLLNRTTRNMSLTEEGKIYFESCARIVAETEIANHNIGQSQDAPSGTLKIAAPISLGNQFIMPLLRKFMLQHSELNVELFLDDEKLDMVKEGIDVSIRVGWLNNSNLIARKLLDWPRYLCASPAYIEQNGLPETPAQLANHECIIFSRLPTPHIWNFTKNKREQKVSIKGRLKVNNADAIRSSLLAGFGIAVQASFLVGEDIKAGRLIHLLPEYECGSVGMFAVYHNRRYQQAKVRLFIELMNAEFKRIKPSH